MSDPTIHELRDQLAIDGGLVQGRWWGDNDTQEWLRRAQLIDRDGNPTIRMKSLMPEMEAFFCTGEGVHYG